MPAQRFNTDNKIMEGIIKTFRIVTLISIILTLTIAAASVIGVAITGFYPGIIVLLLLTLIPVATYFSSKTIISKSNVQRNYYITLISINLLTILVVLWMTFVILIDRIFGNIL